MKAYLGLYTARLETPARSLKEKRALIKPALERLKARFPVSAARLYGLDAWGYEVVGFTLLGNDPAWVEETMRAAARFLAEAGGSRWPWRSSGPAPLSWTGSSRGAPLHHLHRKGHRAPGPVADGGEAPLLPLRPQGVEERDQDPRPARPDGVA